MVTRLLPLHRRRLRPRRFPPIPLRAETRGPTLPESFPASHASCVSPTPPRRIGAERSRYPVGQLGILQVPHPRLFRLLGRAPSRHLRPSRHRPTPTLFQKTTPDQDEMFLQQYPQSHHFQFRKKPRAPLLQMFQARVRFLPMGRRRPPGQQTSLVGRGKVHHPVQRSSSQTQTPRCLMGNLPAEGRARDHRQAHDRHHPQRKINPGEKGNGSLRGQLASRRD